MAEAAGSSASPFGKPGGGGGSVPLTKESFERDLTVEVERMIRDKIFEPQKLFLDYMPAILRPTMGMQPLIVPLIDPSKYSLPHIGYHQQQLAMNKTKTPIARVAVTSNDLEENAELAAFPNNVSLEPAVFNNKTAHGVNASNTVNISALGKRGFIEIKPESYYKSRIPIVIAEEVKNAVTHIFSSKLSSEENEKKKYIENYPIYFIAALPGTNRHLTLLVFYAGIMYSCGIGGTTEHENFSVPVASGAASGGPVAYSMGPSGAGAAMASASGTAYWLGTSGKAMILSPDYLYRGSNSRVFHMGILMPEHLTSLETYIAEIIGTPILNFRKINYYDAQLVGFKFTLDIPFSLAAFPYTRSTNCTRFILDIFGSKIACPSTVLGLALPDPTQCIIKNLSKILESHKTRETEFKKVLEGLTPSGWFRTSVGRATSADYTARDAYITYLLARFIKAYIFNRQDPHLIYDLINSLAAEAEAGGGGGGAAGGGGGGAAGGGGGAPSVGLGGGFKPRHLHKRKIHNRKTKAHRKLRKRRLTKRK